MSLLEDRITRIIELRKLGFDEQKIAEDLSLDSEIIKHYEESTKEAIMNAVSKGYRRIEDIAKRVQLSPIIVNMFMSQYKTEIEEIPHLKKKEDLEQSEERIKEVMRQAEKVSSPIGRAIKRNKYFEQLEVRIKEAINQAIADGAKSVNEIAEITGHSSATIYKYAHRNKIKLEFRRGRRPRRRIELINKLIEEGTNSIQEISEKIGLQPSAILRYERLGYIKLPEDWDRKNIYSAKERPEITELVKQGYNLTEIGKAIGVTREWIRHYIHAQNLYQVWKGAKKGRKGLKNETIRDLIYILEKRAEQLAKENGLEWEYKKSLEYISTLKNRNYQIPLEALIKLFARYKTLKERGEKESLNELVNHSGLYCTPTASRILKAVDLEPLYRSLRFTSRKKLKERKEFIKKAAELISNQDIAYFLNVSQPALSKYSRREVRTGPIKRFYSSRFGEGMKGALTYRLASQIYEAQDLGYNKKEIADLLDTKDKIVEYALTYRKSIQPTIIKALRILYPNKKFNKPYKS